MLAAQENHVKNVMAEAQQQLGQITLDERRYAALLEKLITQALCQVRLLLGAFHVFFYIFLLLL